MDEPIDTSKFIFDGKIDWVAVSAELTRRRLAAEEAGAN